MMYFFWKNKEKHLEISLFYTFVLKTLMIWSTLIEIDCDRLKLVIMSHFLPLYAPPKNPKNQNFEKMEKIGGDVIILQMCTKNLNLMMYGSWDTEWSRKSKFWKNGKTSWNSWNILLCMWTKNKYHMMYDSWNTRCDIQNFWSFWVVFCPFTSLFPPLPPPPPLEALSFHRYAP